MWGDFMARSSKWPIVEENLNLISKWAREGVREIDMCKELGISETTFNEYKHQYPKLKEALKSKKAFIGDLENALAKRALGFEYEETKVVYKKDADGELIESHEKTTKYYPPSVAALSLYLKNIDRDENGRPKWSDNPAKLEIERELAKLRKDMEGLKNF